MILPGDCTIGVYPLRIALCTQEKWIEKFTEKLHGNMGEMWGKWPLRTEGSLRGLLCLLYGIRPSPTDLTPAARMMYERHEGP
jgi:hypothetical protein